MIELNHLRLGSTLVLAGELRTISMLDEAGELLPEGHVEVTMRLALAQQDLWIPGPLPYRADDYATDDPEPWVRPWSGERAPHTGVNLYGSGYTFEPRPPEERS